MYRLSRWPVRHRIPDVTGSHTDYSTAIHTVPTSYISFVRVRVHHTERNLILSGRVIRRNDIDKRQTPIVYGIAAYRTPLRDQRATCHIAEPQPHMGHAHGMSEISFQTCQGQGLRCMHNEIALHKSHKRPSQIQFTGTAAKL